MRAVEFVVCWKWPVMPANFSGGLDNVRNSLLSEYARVCVCVCVGNVAVGINLFHGGQGSTHI